VRINWFSPVPPARTQVAEYTAALLPELARHAQVETWPPSPPLGTRCRDPSWIECRDLNLADANFFHIGNNLEYHGEIWALAQRVPGIVVLHDTRLHHIVGALFANDEAGYGDLMAREHGPFARHLGAAFRRGRFDTEYMAEHFPLTKVPLARALGVVVHTRAAFHTLCAHRRWPVLYLPLHHPASPRTRRPREDGLIRLLLFGYMGPNRRIPSVLAALARSPHRARLRIEVIGTIWAPERIAAMVRDLGLDENVTLHGFVPEAALDEALASADLSINLRNPTMGEASSVQLRTWENSLPSLVTPRGWYAELPPDTVFYVEPDDEVNGIIHHIDAFARNPEPYRAAGKKGRTQLEREHGVAPYAKALIAFAKTACEFRCAAAAFDLTRRTAAELAPWAARTEDLLGRVARETAALLCAS
jgi:glycosyltransferase involved in cell wall biosynthesis